MRRSLVPALLLLVVGVSIPAVAGARDRTVAPITFAQGWFMYAYTSPYDAQSQAQHLALDFGAKNVASIATSDGNYIVLFRTVMGSATVSPDFPYGWKQFASLSEASTEYDGHATATARGVISMYDGATVVYWSK